MQGAISLTEVRFYSKYVSFLCEWPWCAHRLRFQWIKLLRLLRPNHGHGSRCVATL